MQRLIKWYKETTGKREVDMKDVAQWAVSRGFPLPEPVDRFDRLAREFARAARQETKYDEKTGQPYRVNHVIKIKSGDQQLSLWIDIDEASRTPMVKSLILRREQMVGDGLQLTNDADHWSRINPSEEQIKMPLDFTEDIEERKALLERE